MKRCLAMLLMLLLLPFAGAEERTAYSRGDQVADFTFTAWDGQVMSLSAALAEKDAVVLHFFSPTCGGCVEEMPLLQSAYEKYGAQIGFVVVSIEGTDKQLETFCTRRGLTFPVARDTQQICLDYPLYGVPLTLVIDKESVLREIKEGTLPDLEAFTKLISPYLAVQEN